MRNKDLIQKEYIDWVKGLAFHLLKPYGSFQKLIDELMGIEFYSDIPFDENRIEDGRDLRMRFVESITEYSYRDAYLYLHFPVSVLEVMVALAMRCEDTIMNSPGQGDRTGLWLYTMLKNMHLDYADDYNYDYVYVEECVTRLLEHDYEPDGDGGLFKVPGTSDDFRNLEIWAQMNRYINHYYPAWE